MGWWVYGKCEKGVSMETGRKGFFMRGNFAKPKPLKRWQQAALFIASLFFFLYALLFTAYLSLTNPYGGPWLLNFFLETHGPSLFAFLCFPLGIVILTITLYFLLNGARKTILGIPVDKDALLMSCLLYNFTLFFMSNFIVIAFKPAIYIRTPKKDYDTIKVRMAGKVSQAIPTPTVSSVNVIEWQNVVLESNKIKYNHQTYDYLFYECDLRAPKVKNIGWVLERRKGELFWNDAKITYTELIEKFREILSRYGLFENEISDFIDFWLDDRQRLFFGKNDFRFGIFPVPQEELEKIIQIESKIRYPEIIRVHFLIKEIDKAEKLLEPTYPKVIRSSYSLHEWGIMRG